MSLTDNSDWDLILKSLEGNMSPEEKNRIDELIQADPGIEKEFSLFRKIWNTPGTALPKPDVDKALANVLAKADAQADKDAALSAGLAKGKTQTQFLLFKFPAAFSKFIKIAAVLLIALTIAFFLFLKTDYS